MWAVTSWPWLFEAVYRRWNTTQLHGEFRKPIKDTSENQSVSRDVMSGFSKVAHVTFGACHLQKPSSSPPQKRNQIYQVLPVVTRVTFSRATRLETNSSPLKPWWFPSSESPNFQASSPYFQVRTVLVVSFREGVFNVTSIWGIKLGHFP